MLEEDRRLEALRALAVLDTPPERIFDQLADAARFSFDAPIGLVSFIDAERQWFKACPGLETNQTPRDIAFCDHAIRSDDPLVVLDATKDPRFAENPLVTSAPQIRFYAGAPLILPDGERVGTLCVIDLRPREAFGHAECARLVSLAAAVVEALLMRRQLVRHEAMAAASRRKTTMLEQAEGLVGLGAWRWNPLTDEFQASTAAWRTLGYQSSRPRRFAEVFAQADGGSKHLMEFLSATTSGSPASSIEMRINHPDGETRLIALRASVEQAGEARTLSIFGTLLDVTDARRTENALRAREAALRNMIDHAQNAIVSIGDDGVVRSWNQQAEQVFGWPAYEVVGKTLEELIIPARFRSAHRQGMRRFLETGNPKVMGRRFEVTALRRNGEEFPIELALSAVRGPEGWEFTGLMHDISARRAEMELFENAFHHAPIGMTLVATDGRFLKVNEALCRITGRSEDELLACDVQAITHPDDLGDDLELMEQLLSGKISSYTMAKRYIRPAGGHSWVQLSVSLVRNDDGSPKHFVSQVEDRNAQKAAEQALKDGETRYRLMAENTTDMVATTRLDGRLSFVSPACEAVTGWTAAEVVEKKATEFAHPDDVEAIEEMFRKVIAGEPGHALRWRIGHKDGRWVWLESNPSLMNAHGEAGEPQFLDVVRDVTAQVAQEEALAEARIAAESAAAAKAEFLANMSHEIRTPLTAVIGFGSLISARDDLAPDCRQYVDRICSASRGLLTIVNDVLDFSKLEAGQVEIKPRPMTPVEATADAVSMFRGQAAEKGLDLTMATDLDEGLTVMADPERFRQVLLNLVGNAVKFTEAGSVSVTLGWEADRLRVEVRDTGLGLDADAQRKLFQRFSQVDGSSTRRHGGTGLGLAICRGLVEAMGGEIDVSSTMGEGACFRFDIAAPAAMQVPGAEAVIEQGLFEILRILVVDDNPQNRELAKALLERLGAEVTVADGGVEALSVLGLLPFDVVLMDLRMPGMDGRETLERLRSEAGPNQWMPVIAFTAGADLDEAGYTAFDGVVNKPIDIRQLAEVLNMVLNPQADPAWEEAVG